MNSIFIFASGLRRPSYLTVFVIWSSQTCPLEKHGVDLQPSQSTVICGSVHQLHRPILDSESQRSRREAAQAVRTRAPPARHRPGQGTLRRDELQGPLCRAERSHPDHAGLVQQVRQHSHRFRCSYLVQPTANPGTTPSFILDSCKGYIFD